jgi:hypothetical protein
MVPGFTDTECRIAEFRSREMHVHAARQRLAGGAHPTPAQRVGGRLIGPRRVEALVARASRFVQGMHAAKTTTGAVAAPALNGSQ